MSFFDDKHAARLMNTRGELIEIDDSGKIQLVRVHGHYGEQIAKAHRVQSFGMSAVPPKGAHGLIQAVGGRRDQAVLVGLEHPDHRPVNTGAGETIIYNAHGDAVSIVKRNIRVVSPRIDLNPP